MIQTALSQGSILKLGPVTVKKTFDMKAGDKNRYVIVTDQSGEAALKIWGAAANTALNAGDSITLIGTGPKGGIKAQEWPAGSGKWSLNANDCRLELGGGSRTHQEPLGGSEEHVGYSHPESHYSPPTGNSGDKLEAVAKRAAAGTAFYIDELVVNHGFSKDEAIMLAQGAHSMFPLYWGGEKFLH
jgi:hypothetical protein